MARSIYNQYSPLCGFDDNLLCNPYIPDSCRDRHARNELDTLSPKLYASIVPNPASNSAAVVYFSNGSKINKVDIYNQLGELALTKTDPVNSGRVNVRRAVSATSPGSGLPVAVASVASCRQRR